MSGGGSEATTATRVTRSGAAAARASACGPPADQPITANRRRAARGSSSSAQAAERRTPHGRAAPVDGEQANPERGGDRVVGVPREPRVPAPVEVDDGDAVRVRRRRRSSARDDQGRPHPTRSMIGDGAPERVSPGRQIQRQGCARTGRDHAEPGECPRRLAGRAGRADPGRSCRARSAPGPACTFSRERVNEYSCATICISWAREGW